MGESPGGTTLANLLSDDVFRAPMISIAAGRVPGATVKDKFGYDPNVNTSFEPIWSESSTHTFRTTAATMTASSGSSDDAAAGTGCRTLTIEGVDANFNAVVETITLNGTTGVTIPTDLMIVDRAYCVGSGSADINVGNIYVGTGAITSGKPAVVECLIDAAAGQSLVGWTVIPAGFTAYATNVTFTVSRSANVNIDIRIRTKAVGMSWRTRQYYVFFRSTLPKPNLIPRVYEEKTIIVFEAKGSATGNPVSVELEMLLIEDAMFHWPS